MSIIFIQLAAAGLSTALPPPGSLPQSHAEPCRQIEATQSPSTPRPQRHKQREKTNTSKHQGNKTKTWRPQEHDQRSNAKPSLGDPRPPPPPPPPASSAPSSPSPSTSPPSALSSPRSGTVTACPSAPKEGQNRFCSPLIVEPWAPSGVPTEPTTLHISSIWGLRASQFTKRW